MTTALLSPKFQIVIPKEIRNKHQLTPGQKLQLIDLGDRIEIVPLVSAEKLRGSMKSKTPFVREADRKFGASDQKS